MDISIDTSELRTLVADLTDAPSHVRAEVPEVVERGALNIKNTMRDDYDKSAFFTVKGGGAPFITYDITDGGLGAEIGPEKGGQGSRAVHAYFGGANGGGGTVRDPQAAADEEEPNFTRALGDLLDGVL